MASYSHFGMGCGDGCMTCNAIHDVCVRCKIHYNGNTATGGIFIENVGVFFVRAGAGNYGRWSGFSVFGGPTGTFTTFGSLAASGVTLQLTLKRTGADCTQCAGDFCADDFAGALDSLWLEATSPHIYSVSGGRLQGSNGGRPIWREFACLSESATYTLKFCANGTELFSTTITAALSSVADPIIRVGITGSGANGVAPYCEFDDFYADIDQ